MKSASSSPKSIYIRVKPEEYDYISQQAENMNLTISSYGKSLLLDGTTGCKTQFDRIMKLLPSIYAKIDQIEDAAIRKGLKEEVSQICQYLK